MVTESRAKGIHTSYSAVRLLHAPYKTFKVWKKAEEYLATLTRQPALLKAQDDQLESPRFGFSRMGQRRRPPDYMHLVLVGG